MTSLISALSLLILVLINGYFAVPIDDEYTSTPSLLSYQKFYANPAVNSWLVSNHETTEPSTEQNASADFSFTTPESFTQVVEHHARGVEDEGETAAEGEDKDRRDMPMESSTTFISSSVVPQSFVKESTTTLSPPLQIDVFDSSTKKYIGLLKDDKENEQDTGKKLPKKTLRKPTEDAEKKLPKKPTEDEEDAEEKLPKKPLKKPVEDEEDAEKKLPKKPLKKPTEDEEDTGKKLPKKPLKKPTEYKSTDGSEEDVKVKPSKKTNYEQEDDTKDSPIPIAVFDQEALKDVSTISNGVMVLDESNDPIVTVIPDKLSKLNTENKKEQKPLNQGEESSHTEEKKSDN